MHVDAAVHLLALPFLHKAPVYVLRAANSLKVAVGIMPAWCPARRLEP